MEILQTIWIMIIADRVLGSWTIPAEHSLAIKMDISLESKRKL